MGHSSGAVEVPRSQRAQQSAQSPLADCVHGNDFQVQQAHIAPCPQSGCGQQVQATDLQAHRNTCSHQLMERPDEGFKCPDEGCDQQEKSLDLLKHRVEEINRRQRIHFDTRSGRIEVLQGYDFKFAGRRWVSQDQHDPPSGELDDCEAASEVLQDLAAVLKIHPEHAELVRQKPQTGVRGSGKMGPEHSKWWHDLAYNRAECIKDELIRLGVPEHQMTVRIEEADKGDFYIQMRVSEVGQQQCTGVSLADKVVDSGPDGDKGLGAAHAQEVRKKVAALSETYDWQTDPEVEDALARTDLPTYRRILECHRSTEPHWDESVHGAFSGDRRVQRLAVGGFVFSNLSNYMVLVQLLHPALVRKGCQPPRVLDVGCGTGFLTAVLARLVTPRGGSVVAIDIFARQVEHAHRTMSACCPELLPYVTFVVANGLDFRDPRGLPFDAIAVACQATEVPQGLVQQLAPGGHLVAPVGGLSPKDSGKFGTYDKYWLVKKGFDGTVAFSGRAGPISVNFVPLLPPS